MVSARAALRNWYYEKNPVGWLFEAPGVTADQVHAAVAHSVTAVGQALDVVGKNIQAGVDTLGLQEFNMCKVLDFLYGAPFGDYWARD